MIAALLITLSLALTTQPTDEADVLLARIAQRMNAVTSVQATVRWDKVQSLQGDEQRRFGTLTYLAGPPARFAVHFNRLLLDGGRSEEQNRRWIYDGHWLVERNDDLKQFFKRQVDPLESAQGDPLASGEGPFPIPLKPDPEKLKQRFAISLVAASEADPANAVKLRLVPRELERADYTLVELWYDKDTLLPLKARTENDASGDEQTFLLSKVKLDEPVDESALDTTAPSERGITGYLEEVTPWKQAE